MKHSSRYADDHDPSPSSSDAGRNKPIHEIRYGTVKAAIWENRNANGAYHTVSLSRSYKDGATWRRTDSFGRDDLLVVAKAADQAHTWICRRKQSMQSDTDQGSNRE